MAKQKYYAYSVEGDEGVVDNWPECQEIVAGKPSARYKSFTSLDEAEAWLEAGADYSKKNLTTLPGIYFDAGTGAGEGVEVSVTNEKGHSLLHKVLEEKYINERGFYLLGLGVTNNYGELLACKYALQIALQDGAKKIFGDSGLVINYWSKGYIKKDHLPEETIELAEQVKKLRWQFEKNGGEVMQIPGGANPADLGFHKG